jgi:hypothetical protein
VPVQSASYPRTQRAGSPTFRGEVEVTYRSRGLKTASVSGVDFGAQRVEGTLLDCAGFLKRIHRLLQKKHRACS